MLLGFLIPNIKPDPKIKTRSNFSRSYRLHLFIPVHYPFLSVLSLFINSLSLFLLLFSLAKQRRVGWVQACVDLRERAHLEKQGIGVAAIQHGGIPNLKAKQAENSEIT